MGMFWINSTGPTQYLTINYTVQGNGSTAPQMHADWLSLITLTQKTMYYTT